MGVQGLWDILLTIAQPCTIEKLSGKVLAIDASIWLVKISSLFSQDYDKLKAIINKIMTLKRNNILPIFVFDGQPPPLKRKTLEQRKRKRIVADDLDVKKKSEIEIMKQLSLEDSRRSSQRSSRHSKNEEQLGQLNKMLSNLKKGCEEEETEEFIQKLRLQTEILNQKYLIMLQINPQYERYQSFMTPEEYQSLDLEQKMLYLDELQEFRWKNIRLFRRQQKEHLTQEEKIKKDLAMIQKKSTIREMQDNLYRKLYQKNTKIQDGYQIIETIYNGKKVTQKRKIKEQASFFIPGLKKGKMKNDASCLMAFRGGKQASGSEDEGDNFLNEFCSTSRLPLKDEKKYEFSSSSTTRNMFQQPKRSQKQKKCKLKVEYSDQNDESEQLTILYKPNEEEQLKQFTNPSNRNSDHTQLQIELDLTNRDRLPSHLPSESLRYSNQSEDNLELQNLFQILGIPYLIAPGQAEAQCAQLEKCGIVDGIITEDSDIFLFGAKNVYRGVFQNNIRHYSAQKAQQKLKLNRQKFIIFGLLLGSDYTNGVKGVGIVNAMQILKVFNSFDKIKGFKKWAEHPDLLLPINERTKQERQFYQLHKKFKNHWYIQNDFPKQAVIDAYIYPDVISQSQLKIFSSQSKFKDKQCNLVLTDKILLQKMGLSQKQYEHYKKLLTQRYEPPKNILSYFQRREDPQSMAKIRSKRLQKSLQDQ